jgi:hypothetical protein
MPAPTIGQASAPLENPGGGTTISRTLTGVQAGSTLVLHLGYDYSSGTSVTSVADGGGNYTLRGSAVDDTPNTGRSLVYVRENVSAGDYTATATWSAATGFLRARLIEIRGAAASSFEAATGQYQSTPGTGTDAVTSGNVTTLGTDRLILGLSQSWDNIFGAVSGTISAGTSFTIGSPTQREFAYQSRSAPSAGNYAATFTLSAGSAQSTHVLAFKPLSPAPTLVDSQKTAYDNSATPKAVTVSWQAGDIIVWCGQGENYTGSNETLTPTATGLTFAEQQVIAVGAYGYVRVMTAVAAGAGSSVSVSTAGTGPFNGSNWWGADVKVWRNSGGVGASSKANVDGAAPSLNLTTTQANSAIIVYNNDWNAVDGTSRTWRTGAGSLTESNYFRDAARCTSYSGYHADAGSVGTYAVGLSAPGGQKYSIVAIEIKGSAAAAPTITSQPGNTQVPEATRAVFATTATASGGSLTYQWQDNRSGSFANITDGIGATSATYVTDFLPLLASGRRYRCVVTDANGSTNTGEASVTVTPRLPAERRRRTRGGGGTDFGTDIREWW